MADSFSNNTIFWKNVSYLNQANKSLPDVVDKANGCKQVSHVFLEKYKTIYTNVPTPDIDMAHNFITNKISNRISNTDCIFMFRFLRLFSHDLSMFYHFMLYHSSVLEFIMERYISIVYYYLLQYHTCF